MIADSPTTINTGLAELAVAVAPQTAELPSEHRAELGVRWLATHTGWLLVLDNLFGVCGVVQHDQHLLLRDQAAEQPGLRL
ncbi:hypothetical protein [Lentzea tibetensis]|uniref:hypothetical protein n=1 Tax=Lentzea tibetensis TaxID=2591470 RepID=UPI001F46D589|nr:hypothetical protein [Lentzea tibetensis]